VHLFKSEINKQVTNLLERNAFFGRNDKYIVEIKLLCTLQNPKQSANYATHRL